MRLVSPSVCVDPQRNPQRARAGALCRSALRHSVTTSAPAVSLNIPGHGAYRESVKPTTVLFDLDGTLTDPLVGIANSVRHALVALGVEPPSTSELRRWVGPPLRESFASLDLSPPDVTLAVERYREYFSERGLYENAVYPGIKETVIALVDRGCRLAVATSKPTVFAERILDHFDLARYFEVTVGSELDGRRSNKHAVIAAALSAMSVAELATAVMVGDREHDVVGAATAGVRSVGVRWGYASNGELEAAGASIIVSAPHDLLSVLLHPDGG